MEKKPKWSGRNKKSGLRLSIQAHNIPFVTVWFLASLDHDEKKEEQIIMTWSFIHNPLFCWINKRMERLWVGKLLAHETGRPKLLKQAALVELASGCIKRDHVSHQATCTEPSARFRFTGWLRHSFTVGPVGGNALFISRGFPFKCSYTTEAFGWVTRPGWSLYENHHTWRLRDRETEREWERELPVEA